MPADLRTSSRRAIRRRVRDAAFAVVTAFVIPAVVFIGVGAVRVDAVETERRCGVARTVAAQAAADAHEAMTRGRPRTRRRPGSRHRRRIRGAGGHPGILGRGTADGAVSSAAAVLDRRVQDLTRHVARLLEEHTAHSAAG